MKWQITLVKPPGNIHAECFREVAETLLYGLRRIGEKAELNVNTLRPGSRHIILGAHLLNEEQVELLPHDSIIYNLEQLQSSPVAASYFWLAKRFPIWDYSRQNIGLWGRLLIPAKEVPIGYVPELRKIKPAEKDIDVLFYGSMNDRRSAVIAKLRDAGLKVETLFGDYGAFRDGMIARSRVVLNVHHYDAKIFEIVRVSYLMANGVAVVTESSPDIPADIRPGLAVAPYDHLVLACLRICHSVDRRADVEATSFKYFSRRVEEDILKSAIA